jgi:predicted ferric reductase
MALSNVAFITFLALKNTPLAFLTSYSYERLNPLHQIGGYTTVTFALLHMILMLDAFLVQEDNKDMFLALTQIHGMIALGAMFTMLLTATFVRKMRYEAFYVTHITMYMLVVINVGMHRPDYTLKALIITTVAGSIWGTDRVLRGCKLLWYLFDNKATITPLPHGGTRIVLRRSPARAKPGTHCFLWIPKIRLIETHPFTIVAATPYSLELVIAAYDGFTNDLHQYALKHPGASMRASIDGPYGAIPNFAKVADRAILVAGGSGASFTFGVALDMIKKLGGSRNTTIDFIWAVRDHGTDPTLFNWQ